MNIELLYYFNKVASSKSISKTAKECHMTQSALSQQIHKLEDDLGRQLLTRSNKGVELTDMGQIVLNYSKHILKIYEKMVLELNDVNQLNQTIKIQACHSIANYSLPCFLFEMKKKFPHHKYELSAQFSKVVIDNIINDICDIAFAYDEEVTDQMLQIPIGRNKYILVASMDYPIEDELGHDDFLKYPFIVFQQESTLLDELKEILKKHGYILGDLNVLFELDSIEAVKSSVARGHGISLLPYSSVKEELYKKTFKEIILKDIKIDPETFVFVKSNKLQNKLISEFIAFIKEDGHNSFC